MSWALRVLRCFSLQADCARMRRLFPFDLHRFLHRRWLGAGFFLSLFLRCPWKVTMLHTFQGQRRVLVVLLCLRLLWFGASVSAGSCSCLLQEALLSGTVCLLCFSALCQDTGSNPTKQLPLRLGISFSGAIPPLWFCTFPVGLRASVPCNGKTLWKEM